MTRLLLISCLTMATCQVSAAEDEPLRVLCIGDYHMGQGGAMRLLQRLLVAGGHPAVVKQIGDVHSDLIHEWENREDGRRGSLPWLTGAGELTPPAKIKQQEGLLAKGPPVKPSPEELADKRVAKKYDIARNRFAKIPRTIATMQMSGHVPDVVILSAGSRLGFAFKDKPKDKRKGEAWTAAFIEAARHFKELADQHNTRVIMLGTMRWSVHSKPTSITREVTAMDAGYRATIAAVPMTVAPAYRSFAMAYAHEGLQPFSGCQDGTGHYGGRSAYLYACTMYAAITGTSPVGLPVPKLTYQVPDPERKKGDKTPPTMAEVTPEQGRILQELAWAAHQEWQQEVTP